MDQPRERETERLRNAVHSARASVEHTVTKLHERVHHATDLKEQIRAHPIAALSIASVAGFLVGRQIVALFGFSGIATLRATSLLRAARPTSNGHVVADRIINHAGAVFTSAVLVPVVSGLRTLIESAISQPTERASSRFNGR